MGASACGTEAPAPDAGTRAVVGDADQPYLGLDGGLPKALPSGWSPGAAGVDVGAFVDFAAGHWRFNAGVRAIVTRDAGGLFAYSALCTHEGCLIAPPGADGVAVCPCHASRFDGEGRVVGGPAVGALPRFAVRVVGGRVLVDPGTRVDAAARALPMPDAGPVDGSVPSDAQPVDGGPVDGGSSCDLGTDVGALADFASGTWTRIAARSLIVARDGGGLFAYTARCPHQNCLIEPPAAVTGDAACACHGSRFDGNGRVTNGPARADLVHYAVHLCAGRVRVDAETLVAATVRTPAS